MRNVCHMFSRDPNKSATRITCENILSVSLSPSTTHLTRAHSNGFDCLLVSKSYALQAITFINNEFNSYCTCESSYLMRFKSDTCNRRLERLIFNVIGVVGFSLEFFFAFVLLLFFVSCSFSIGFVFFSRRLADRCQLQFGQSDLIAFRDNWNILRSNFCPNN